MSEVVQGPWSDRQLAEGEEKAKPVQLPRGIAGGGGGPHDPGMEARIAVLEQIAKDTRDSIADLRGIRGDIQGFRKEVADEIRDLRRDARSDYRWLLGIMLGGFAALLGVMARGFHWF